MTPLLDSPIVERLGMTLLHFIWQGAAIALLLGGLLTLLRRSNPQTRYIASLAALLLMGALPVATFTLLPRQAAASRPQRIASYNPPAPTPAPQALTTTNLSVPTNSANLDAESLRTAPSIPSHPIANSRKLPLRERITQTLSAAAPWLVPAWALGVIVLSLWNFTAWAALQRLKARTTQIASDSLHRIAQRIAGELGLRHPVRLLQTTAADSPLVLGFLKPVILLPASLLTQLPPAQLEALLAHELAHIRRHDYLVNLLQTLIETLLFYHPAVWWISGRIRHERELCCDDMAVAVTRDRRVYVRALAAVADLRAPALATAASGGVLLPRLRRILGLPNTETPSRALAGLSILALAALFALTATLARAADDTLIPHPYGYVDPAHPYPVKDPQQLGTCTLAGQVIDTMGNPVAGIHVQLGNGSLGVYGISVTRPSDIGSAATDAQGRFRLNYLYSGRTDLWAETADASAAGWTRGLDSNARDVVVALKRKAQSLSFEGRVLDTDGKSPVPNSRMLLCDYDDSKEEHQVFRETKTDGEGRYRFEFEPRWSRSSSMWIIALPENRAIAWCMVPYVSGSNLDLQLKPESVFRGRVLDPAGRPLAGAKVLWDRGEHPDYGLFSFVGVVPAARTQTDAQGDFVLRGLPQGTHVTFVQASHPDFQTKYYRDLLAARAEEQLPDLQLTQGATIEGTITLAGKPVAGAKVTHTEPGSRDRKTTLSDEDGHYRFTNAFPGRSQNLLSAESGGTPPQWEASAYSYQRKIAGQSVTVDLALKPSFEVLEAQWKLQAGKPLPMTVNQLVFDDVERGLIERKAVINNTLYLRDPSGKVLWEKKGFKSNLGWGHHFAADKERQRLWLCPDVSGNLLQFSMDGRLLFEKTDVKANTIALDSKTGDAWVLTNTGSILGDQLAIYSAQGELKRILPVAAMDIAYSAHDDCFWVVGKNYQKIDRTGRVLATSAKPFAYAASFVSINEDDGSAWVTEQRHTQVGGSDQTLIVNSDGTLRNTLNVDDRTGAAIVDAPRKVAWISGSRLYKVDLEGNVLAEIPVWGMDVEPDTGYVWCRSRDGKQLYRLDTDGRLVSSELITGNKYIWLVPQ